MLTAHVGALCKATYFHIRALHHIRKTLSIDDTKTVVSALIDYANSVWYGVSAANISKLQRIQNLLAIVVTCAKHRAESSRLLIDLHWLPIKHRIDFKIATITFKIRSTAEPSNLASLVSNYIPGRGLRSDDLYLLHRPLTKTVIGSRAFRSTAPKVWNYLPADIRSEPPLLAFRRKLKTLF